MVNDFRCKFLPAKEAIFLTKEDLKEEAWLSNRLANFRRNHLLPEDAVVYPELHWWKS